MIFFCFWLFVHHSSVSRVCRKKATDDRWRRIIFRWKKVDRGVFFLSNFIFITSSTSQPNYLAIRCFFVCVLVLYTDKKETWKCTPFFASAGILLLFSLSRYLLAMPGSCVWIAETNENPDNVNWRCKRDIPTANITTFETARVFSDP